MSKQISLGGAVCFMITLVFSMCTAQEPSFAMGRCEFIVNGLDVFVTYRPEAFFCCRAVRLWLFKRLLL